MSNYYSCHCIGACINLADCFSDEHPVAEQMMLGRVVGGLATATGVSLGSIWLLDSNRHHQKLASTFPWTLRAAEEEQKLPRVYFIIRFDRKLTSTS